MDVTYFWQIFWPNLDIAGPSRRCVLSSSIVIRYGGVTAWEKGNAAATLSLLVSNSILIFLKVKALPSNEIYIATVLCLYLTIRLRARDFYCFLF